MVSLGIVIAVSEYSNTAHLPACRKDGNAVAELLKRTGRFDEVIHVSGANETVSASVKNTLSSFADAYRGQNVAEILFYFSGHGDFDGEDFRYILSDYNAKRPSQTTLSNSELDGILRGLSPELFVKIVDACNSGISYIKGEEDLSTYLKGSRTGFNNVYFMFSSQSDEASYATEHVSLFTRSLLKAVAEAPDGAVRYRDLMSVASDEFASSGSGQTPKFVTQANLTEIFCEASEAMRSLIQPYLKSEDVQPPPAKSALSLLDRIRNDEKDYCTQDEAVKILEKLAQDIIDWPMSEDLTELFEITIFENPGIAPQGQAIGVWLEDNADRGFFARPARKTETYTDLIPKGGLSQTIAQMSNPFGRSDPNLWQEVKKTRQVIESYRTSTELPYGHLILEITPKLKALTPYRCIIAPVISRTHLVLFWRFLAFDYSDWEKLIQRASSKWARAEAPLKKDDVIQATVGEIWNLLHDFVMGPLLERWPDPDNSEAEEIESVQGKEAEESDDKT